MHRFRERAWAIASLWAGSQLVTGEDLAALIGTAAPRSVRTRGKPVSRRVPGRVHEWSSVTYMKESRSSRGDTAETQLAELVPVLDAIARIPAAQRPVDLEVSVTVHLSIYTNAATISREVLASIHSAGAELDFWTDQEGRDRRTRRGGGY